MRASLALFRFRGIMVVVQAIGWRLLPVRHAIVPNYAGNAQPVVTKHACSSRRLGDAVSLQFSPLFHCCLISKERERKDLSWLVQTFEPLDGYEPVNLIQKWPQFRGDVEIFLPLSLSRPYFENDSDHDSLFGYSTVGPGPDHFAA